jgi:hypothetical protein
MSEHKFDKIVSESSTHAIAMSGPCVVAVWRQKIAVDAARHATRAVRDAVNAHRDAASYFGVVEQGVAPPDDAVRAEFREMLGVGKGAGCAGLVAEGTGFQSSVVRAVIGGLLLAVRSPCPIKVFAQVPDAATWVAMTTRLGADGGQRIAAVAEALRARLGRLA